MVTVSTRPDVADVGPEALAGFTLWAPGDHYLADALLALAAGRTLGYADAELAAVRVVRGDPPADGAQGRGRGVRVYDSYAHHPTEISGDLHRPAPWPATADSGGVPAAPGLPDPALGVAMGEALGAADEVVVCDVYVAREMPTPP